MTPLLMLGILFLVILFLAWGALPDIKETEHTKKG